MINTISNTLEAQEKTQDIKQSPSTKIGTKPDARSRKNKLTEVTGRCIGRCTGRSDQATAESIAATGRCTGCCTGRIDAQDAAQDAECQSPVNISKVLESRFHDRTRPISADRMMVRVRSIAEKRDFIPNGYFLSGAYK